jgi:hypothetical protein
MVFPLEHPARIWCQPRLNQGIVSSFQKLGIATWSNKYLVENTAYSHGTQRAANLSSHAVNLNV